MQVFRTAEKEPVPIETDPVVQMETIHAAMRVRDSVLFAGSLIFYILLLLPLLLLTRSAGNRAAWSVYSCQRSFCTSFPAVLRLSPIYSGTARPGRPLKTKTAFRPPRETGV